MSAKDDLRKYLHTAQRTPRPMVPRVPFRSAPAGQWVIKTSTSAIAGRTTGNVVSSGTAYLQTLTSGNQLTNRLNSTGGAVTVTLHNHNQEQLDPNTFLTVQQDLFGRVWPTYKDTSDNATISACSAYLSGDTSSGAKCNGFAFTDATGAVESGMSGAFAGVQTSGSPVAGWAGDAKGIKIVEAGTYVGVANFAARSIPHRLLGTFDPSGVDGPWLWRYWANDTMYFDTPIIWKDDGTLVENHSTYFPPRTRLQTRINVLDWGGGSIPVGLQDTLEEFLSGGGAIRFTVSSADATSGVYCGVAFRWGSGAPNIPHFTFWSGVALGLFKVS